MLRNLGIMGGTFNPIHLGHLLVAQEAMFEFGLDEILFIPNKTPPHRIGEPDLVDSEDRFIMVNLAVSSNPGFFVSRIELDRDGVSYTLDTVKQLRLLYPETDFTFITGVDSILSDRWRGLDELLKQLARFVTVTRPGFDEKKLSGKKEELKLKFGDKIVVLKIPGIDISSTMIRERVRQGKPIKYLVAESVEKYIYKRDLYKT
jgi:nicotinate-nucleotide adenylyltransferase